MLGAIAGDVIGSVHEGMGTQTKSFPLFDPESTFTDDSVLTCALADAYLRGLDYTDALHEYFHLYPAAGYGGTFMMWAAHRRRTPYQSWGNGSAMRASPAAYWADNLEEVLALAEASAAPTHNHPEGIKGAKAVAACTFMARKGATKAEIKNYAEAQFDYFLDDTIDQIRPTYSFDVSCQGSVPQSIIAFLESEGFEDAVRNAISLGGDADTMACIAGAIAEPFYGGVPGPIADEVMARLDDRLRGVVEGFRAHVGLS